MESEYIQKIHTKFEELQRALRAKTTLELSFDFNEGTAYYLGAEGEINKINFTLISSYGQQSETLKWAWANDTIDTQEEYNEFVFREISQKTNNYDFQRSEEFHISEQERDHLYALLVNFLDGKGLVAKSYDTTTFYFLISEIDENLDPEIVPAEIITLGLYALFTENKVDLFNMLKKKRPDIKLNFIDEDLRGEAQPWNGDLHAQKLFDLDYKRQHRHRVLDGINLDNCRFDGSNFQEVSLRNCSFNYSVLINVNFGKSDLTNVNFKNAFLNGANFTDAILDRANFKNAELGRTLFLNTNLSDVKGLDETKNVTGSEISFSTLTKSSFQVSEKFMRNAGVSLGLIEDLRRGKRIATKYSTCFLSYSSRNKEFAQKIYYSLLEAGVRVYWDASNLLAGEYLDVQLINAIKENDRTITIFSEYSCESRWVLKEVQAAMHYKPKGFIPVRICTVERIKNFIEKNEIKPDILELYPILNFTNWEDEEVFEVMKDKLLLSLRR